jgi:hypothetical protein
MVTCASFLTTCFGGYLAWSLAMAGQSRRHGGGRRHSMVPEREDDRDRDLADVSVQLLAVI